VSNAHESPKRGAAHGGPGFWRIEELRLAPVFYEAATVFCELLEQPLESFLGKEEAAAAHTIIKASRREKISTVKERISAHARVFKEKSDEERLKLRNTTPKGFGERLACPACETIGVVDGRAIRESEPTYSDGALTSEETYVAESFVCRACGLKLTSLEEIVAADIEPTFQMLTEWDPRDGHPRTDDGPDYDNM
jgi:hypothetical protein